MFQVTKSLPVSSRLVATMFGTVGCPSADTVCCVMLYNLYIQYIYILICSILSYEYTIYSYIVTIYCNNMMHINVHRLHGIITSIYTRTYFTMNEMHIYSDILFFLHVIEYILARICFIFFILFTIQCIKCYVFDIIYAMYIFFGLICHM